MYLLSLITILGLTFPAIVVSEVNPGEEYLLPKNIIPKFYDVKLFLDPNNAVNFTGEVSIQASVETKTFEIVVHAMGMNIATDAIRVNPMASNTPINLVERFTLATDDTHFLRIFLRRELQALEDIVIHIAYTSRYAENMFGVYRLTYISQGMPQHLLTSQLQPTYARRAFPCFDEPSFKAVFRTTIYAPPSYNVVRTNMPLSNNSHQIEHPGWTKYEFLETPIMSTYLQGYIVSNFDNIETVNAGSQKGQSSVPFKIYSRPATQDSAIFAQDFAQQSLFHLERLFGFADLKKVDKIAVPGFAAEAVGNWGLCMYREESLLVRNGSTTSVAQQNVGRIISREMAQFWFGNDVTPVSWKYLWLSEGLATYYGLYSASLVEPRWRVYHQFVLEMHNVFQLDAVLNVTPMTNPVYTPLEILGSFNAISSQKAAAVIRMLDHVVTNPIFQQGTVDYLQNRSRTSVDPTDFYTQLERTMWDLNHGIMYDVDRFMDTWVNQAGFPVLRMDRLGASVAIYQERYLTDGSVNITGNWLIPISIATTSNPNFTATQPFYWIDPRTPFRYRIPNFSVDNDWFIFNVQQTGYFRVNYDEENWTMLTKQLNNDNKVIHVLNRAGLLDDAFNLARSGRLHYNYTLNMSRYLVHEEDYIPFAAVNPSFTYLDLVLSGTRAYSLFQNYIRNITETWYSHFDFERPSWDTTDPIRPLFRNIILDLNCRHGNDDCINKAAALMKDLQANPGQNIHPDIQTVVYCTSLRGGNPDDFIFLWDMYLGSTDTSQRSILLNALGCTTNAFWRSFYLNQALIENSSVRDQDRHTVIISVINSSPENINPVLEVVVQDFNLIKERVQSMNGVTNILNALAGKLTTQAHSNRVDELVRLHSSRLTAADWNAIAAIRENIVASIAWRTQHAATVEAWLEDNYGSNAAALTSSLILLISVFTTIFNR